MPFEKWNIKHQNQAEKDAYEVVKLFDELINQVAVYASAIALQHDIFKFRLFPALQKRIDDLLHKHAFSVQTSVEKSVTKHWELSNVKNDTFIKKAFKKHRIKGNPIATRNAEGLNAFRKRKGRKLSSRIWKQTTQLRNELEMAIDTAIKDGTPANQLATELKKYLKEPDKLFRKYRDNNGQLQLSKNAKAYNPGQGVYRSSYKNSERLARTEMNIAYRLADIDRWQSLGFIVGYEIKRSKHPYPCATCDMMAGRYPKDFVWSGNHPNCRCYLVPIFKYDASEVEVNPKLIKWISDNQDKIQRAKSLPYFLRDNPKYWENKLPPKTLNQLMNKAKSASFMVDNTAKNIALKYKGYVTPINLKSKQSILRKLKNECNGDISQIKDAVRTTIILPKNKIEKCIADLEKNTIFVRIRRQTPDKYMGYSGTLTNIQTNQGILGEIQVNTEKMIYAKEKPTDAIRIIGKKRWQQIRKETGLDGGLGHKYYEEYRVTPKTTPEGIKRRLELEKLSNEYYKHFR